MNWVVFWIVFAVITGGSSMYHEHDPLREVADVIICTILFVTARIEYLFLNKLAEGSDK